MKYITIILSILLLSNFSSVDAKEAFFFNYENYQADKLPVHWSQHYTGTGENSLWNIVDDNGNKVLAQLSSQNLEGHFNVVVFNDIQRKNVNLKVKFKGVSGKRDQGGGFVWRFIDADNYYIVRANPLEDNVVLYKMENGKRIDLPLLNKGDSYGVDVAKLGSGWNGLGLKVVDNLFTVYLNGKQIFQVKDDTFSQAGKVGFWTKADAVTYFDDFEVLDSLH
jgi:hypothetical protein